MSTFGNVNYRFPLYSGLWVEPTAGFLYTYSLYDNAAAALGLSDGYVLRLQGGSRIGADLFWNGVLVQPVITALVYDDVKVVGGPIFNGAFVGGPLIGSDEGKLRGEGIFAVNFDYGNGGPHLSWGWYTADKIYLVRAAKAGCVTRVARILAYREHEILAPRQ